mgnify:CR=1 FL=1|tara:strand:- start:594 stop:1865 length:1272 start_codon:yes stop_codon:yes gene_type:complete
MNIKEELSHFIKQYGGKLLGSGTYGCVFGPNYQCNIDDIKDENLISKIIPKSASYEEYYNIIKLNIHLIESYEKFFVIPQNICELKEQFLNEEFNSCPMVSNGEYQPEDLFNIIQPYAGYDLHKIVTHRNILTEYIPESDKLLLHFFNLLVGLGLLNKYDCVHRDIKPANITMLKGKLARFIDYGLSTLYYKSILNSHGELEHEWDWASTDYVYWPRDLKILSSEKNNGLHTKIQNLLSDKTQEESIVIIIREAAKLFKLYSDYSLHFHQEDKQAQFQSLVEFMIDVFVKKIIDDDTFDVSGHLIQSKWDVFSLGQSFSEILKRSKIELSDEALKTKLHELITSMVSLHPFKRPTIKECIERFAEIIPDTIISKYNDELNELFRIAREQLEIELEEKVNTPQSEIDYGSDSESEIDFDLSDED